MLSAVGAGKKNLLVNETVDAKFVKGAANITGTKTTFAGSVNTYDVLNADKLIISVGAAKMCIRDRAEAVEQKCELIVAHHPVIFAPLKQLGPEDMPFRLVQAGV